MKKKTNFHLTILQKIKLKNRDINIIVIMDIIKNV